MTPEDLMLVLVLCFWGRFRDSVAVSKDVTKVPKFLAENFSPCHGPGSISESWRDHVVIRELVQFKFEPSSQGGHEVP
jgi:hypothetical protein